MKKTTNFIFYATLLFIIINFISAESLYAEVKTEVGAPSKSGIITEVGGASKSNIFPLQNPLNKDISSVGDLIQAVIEILTYLFIIFAVLMFIYIGFQYVTNAAQGNAKKIEELHKQLMWLVIGVAVVIGARVIIQVVINTIAATNTVSPSVIDSANKAAKIK
jgi:heme/copper-type cytochrome/quinol oxidase subunit 2